MPLSHPKVISLLNSSFIPVYLANQDYRDGGAAPPEEKAELRRILQEGHALKLSVGSVHAYVLSPEGKTADSLHVAEAFKVEKMIAMLEGTARKFAAQAGEPVVKPAAQSRAKAAPGSLVLHVTARYLEKKGDDYALVQDAGGNWSAFPGEDWITLDRAASTKLLPPGEARPGLSWDVDREVAATLYHRFYPPTENNDLAKNRIDEQALKATVVSVEKGIARVRLEGSLKMKHPFYHKDDGNFATATVAGYLEYDPARRTIRTFRLVTEQAGYGDERRQLPFGVVVRSVS